MTGLGSVALATAGVTPAVAATSDPTPITPKKVNPEVPVEDGDTLGAITDVEQDGATVTLEAEHGAFRATFLDERTLRLEATPTGEFTDPANTPENDPARTADIVVGSEDFDGASVDLAEGDTITISTPKVTLEVDRATGATTLTRADGSIIWSESEPLSFGTRSATQHLDAVEGEQFLGGGMQNGRSIHTGATINVARNFDWDDDGYPNAVPYYMSSNGYGVLRNTFAAGSYDFAAHTTTHAEQRFDAYYFVGDYTDALDSYTKLTGRPMMPPVYALEYGDADCYNRSSPTYSGSKDPAKLRTPQALEIAKDFVENDMPAGWMLVNDGYGCEYQELPETVDAIEARDRAEDRPLDPALADPAGVRGRRGRRAPAQARRRVGGLGLPARAHRLRSGPRRHRAVLRRPRHLADGRGLGGVAALRHAVDRRPLGQPRRRALAGLGAHGCRQLGHAVHHR